MRYECSRSQTLLMFLSVYRSSEMYMYNMYEYE